MGERKNHIHAADVLQLFTDIVFDHDYVVSAHLARVLSLTPQNSGAGESQANLSGNRVQPSASAIM
jgi:hypothetical protein